MKLVYCYIQDYIVFKDQGFNFGSEYIYKHQWDENKLIITSEKNDKYIPDYFKIDVKGFENVTAIVGENGVGKSLLLKKIFSYLANFYTSDFENKIFILFENGKYLSNISEILTDFKEEKIEILNFGSSNYLYFYSSFFDFGDNFHTQSFYNNNINNVSPIYFNTTNDAISLINEDVNRNVSYLNQVQRHIVYINFLKDNYKSSFGFRFFNKNLIIKVNPIEIRQITNFDSSIIDNLRDNLRNNFQKFDQKYPINELSEEDTLLIFFFKNCINDLSSNNKKINLINEYIIENIDSEKILKYFVECFLWEILNVNRLDFEYIINFCSNLISKNKPELELLEDYKSILLILKLKGLGPLDFRWEGLSSGELAFLNLFSNFYFKIPKPNNTQNLLIFIDEGELGFHVRWQQKYLDFLIKGLSEIFQKGDNPPKMQLIFTTHSPIVLSDIPNEHVVFIESKENDKKEFLKKTEDKVNLPTIFAANIHDILRHSFFMDNTFVGEYVKNKVNEVVYFLNHTIIKNDKSIIPEDLEKKLVEIQPYEEKDKKIDFEKLSSNTFFEGTKKTANEGIEIIAYKNLETFISNIDEPILKIKLNEMYHEAIGGSAEKGRLLAQQQIIEHRLKELGG